MDSIGVALKSHMIEYAYERDKEKHTGHSTVMTVM